MIILESNMIKMINPTEAIAIIKENIFFSKIVSIPLENCMGYQLAEDLFADRDFPPFHRAMMDGIAVQNLSTDSWEIEQTVFAGQPQATLSNPEACIQIMTGAPLPIACRSIIPVEEIEIQSIENKRIAKFKATTITEGQFIHQRGADIKKDQLLIAKNTTIGTIEIALAASIGKTHLQVVERPTIALISTGDELVQVNQMPLPHQIRSSNIPMLSATLKSKGFICNTFHINDSKEKLKEDIAEILQNHNYIILSGGVSAGQKDFIPEVLNELGFTCHFHKIAQKPGKPMWFGTRAFDQKTIFALPGNPISTLICFYNYFLPSILNKENTHGIAEITNIKPANAGLDLWLPAKWLIPFQQAEILPNNGSGDMVGWKDADIIIWQKAGDNSVYLPYVQLI